MCRAGEDDRPLQNERHAESDVQQSLSDGHSGGVGHLLSLFVALAVRAVIAFVLVVVVFHPFLSQSRRLVAVWC